MPIQNSPVFIPTDWNLSSSKSLFNDLPIVLFGDCHIKIFFIVMTNVYLYIHMKYCVLPTHIKMF